MKKRLALAWAPLVIGLALMLPASTMAATGYTSQIVDQHCISGGHNIYFRASVTAAGTTPANKLTIKSTSQYYSGGTWHNFYRWRTSKDKFTANGTSHTADYSYTHKDNSSPYQWRITSVLKALQGTHVLYSHKLTSRAC